MLIDFHTHLFPPEMCRQRDLFFDGEPSFSILYESPKAKLITAESLIPMMDEDGVNLSVVFGFPWKNPEYIRMNNDYIIECTEKYPDRIKGFACFDLFAPNIAEETERCLNHGLSGVGELALYTRGIDQEAICQLGPVMEILKTRNLPVMIHTNEPVGYKYPGKAPMTLKEIENLVAAFPENTIVLAHLGGGIPFYTLLKKEMKEKLAHVYYDIAAIPFLYDISVYRHVAEIAGDDKIILGTDFPLIRPSRYLRDLGESGLDEKALKKITGANAAKLLGLD